MRTNEEKKFKETCYETYRTLWLLKHGFTLNELMRRLSDHAVEELREMPIEDQSNATDVRAFMDSLADCLWTDGFEAGCIYKSEKEFYGREFLDPAYMEQLFSFMPGDKDELLASWYEISGVNPPEKEEETLEVKTPAGTIHAYKNTDPGQPGIMVRLLPDGYRNEVPLTNVFVDPEQAKVYVRAADPQTLYDDLFHRYTRGCITRKHLFMGGFWKIRGVGFMDIGSKESGWPYKLYNWDYEEICRGNFDDPAADPVTVRDRLAEKMGWQKDKLEPCFGDEVSCIKADLSRKKLKAKGWTDDRLDEFLDCELAGMLENDELE